MSWLSDFLGGKKEQGQFQQYNPADYLQLKDLLYGVQEKGYPEMMQESYWGEPWRQTEQGIMEDLRAKRGLGVASTPEITQREFARSNLMSNLMGQNLNVRQNALNMLAGITPRPTTQYTPEGPSGLENLLSFGAPIASTALSGYLQGQNPMNKAMTKYLTSQITPKSPSSVYDYETDPNANLELLKLLPMLMGGM